VGGHIMGVFMSIYTIIREGITISISINS